MKPEDSGRFDRVLLEDALPAAEPTAGFADRVVAAVDRKEPPRRWPVFAAAAAGIAATVLVFMTVGHHSTLGGSGRVDVGARAEVQLGGRGIAVAEEGSTFDWRVGKDGAAKIDQTQGNVFYRVERGEPFVVSTPAGEVEVKGTCFRVEVQPMSLKHAIVGATAGAALATVVVTVYEGHVAVRNAHGATEVGAGSKVGMTQDNAPSAALAVAGDPQKAALLAGAPPDTATRDDLLTRDTVHRQQIAALENQVKELSRMRVAAPAANNKEGGRPERTKMHDFTQDELKQMAANCEVRWDAPDFDVDGHSIPADEAQKLGLTAQDMAAYQRILKQTNADMLAQARQIYRDVTGESGDNLEFNSMWSEVEGKLGRKEWQQARTRLSQEKAGMMQPQDPAQQSPAYRFLKLMSGTGDAVAQQLDKEIGSDKERALRDAAFGSHHIMSGCPGQK
jgi:hypothetical protein